MAPKSPSTHLIHKPSTTHFSIPTNRRSRHKSAFSLGLRYLASRLSRPHVDPPPCHVRREGGAACHATCPWPLDRGTWIRPSKPITYASNCSSNILATVIDRRYRQETEISLPLVFYHFLKFRCPSVGCALHEDTSANSDVSDGRVLLSTLLFS